MVTRYIALALLACVFVGCGGTTRKSGEMASTGGTSSSGGTAASVDEESGAVEPIGEAPDKMYPASPGEASFFWKLGLGNWFVATSDGRINDARRELSDGTPTFEASNDDPTLTLDLLAQLNHPTGGGVDLSEYAGISFDVKLTGTSVPISVMFDAHGIPENGDHPSKDFVVAADWTTQKLRFAELNYDASATTSIDFVVQGADAPFELRVRNLALLCKRACP